MARQPTPDILATLMAPFAACFTRPTFANVLVLVVGAILAPGRRTVASALSSIGRRGDATFTTYHRVLNRSRWSGRAVARCLLGLLVEAFVPTGPVVIGIDETIERRWGPKIAARGIYRDPVRSSKGHFVKASGLRWISVMLLAPVPFAGRVWGLPFLTALAPSERYAKARGRRHKSLTDRARQLLLLVARWLPDRRIVAVADTSYAAIDLLAALRRHVTLITRLRLDAGLFDPPPPRRPPLASPTRSTGRGPKPTSPGTRGRPRVTGPRQPTLMKRLSDPKTVWQRIEVIRWYGHGKRQLDIASGTALWSRAGQRVPIRWVLVRDVEGLLKPQAFLRTDETQEPGDILRFFVRRWSVEVTFAEVRRHLGVETQRQWSDLAIARTTPSLLALFSLVTLWTADLFERGLVKPRHAAWYAKSEITVSDAIAAVRSHIRIERLFSPSRPDQDTIKIPRDLYESLIEAASYSA